MNISDVLSFKPEIPQPSANGYGSGTFKAGKKGLLDPSDTSTESGPSGSKRRRTVDPESLDDGEAGGEMDEIAVKRVILQLEKRTLRNQEMRIKYAELPEKFMESEVELHDILQEMQVVATVPEHYSILVSLRSVECLLQLISHDNTDISLAVIDLLHELTDSLADAQDPSGELVEALLAGQLVPLLINNFGRLDETVKEEADGVHNTLGIFENLCEFRPESCTDLAKQGLMAWLLKRIQKREFDPNKLYVSEILAILLQEDETNRELLGELEGIDCFLQQLAAYKRHDPNTREECEMMENLFNCLCSALLLKTNRDKFLRGEGLQLMNLMLREKKLSRNSALKVLDFAMSGEAGAENCVKFVDILGLRTIFPLFMRTPKKQKRAGPGPTELEEHIISVVAALIRHTGASQKNRVLAKFSENDYEKVDRTVEFHFKYFAQVKLTDARIQRERKDPSLWTATTTEELEEEIYLRRLDGGLCTLQLIDTIIMEICVHNQAAVRERVLQLLRMRNASPKVILRIVEECADNMGDTARKGENKESLRLVELMKQFEASL